MFLNNWKVSKEHKGCDGNVSLCPSACSKAIELGAKDPVEVSVLAYYYELFLNFNFGWCVSIDSNLYTK